MCSGWVSRRSLRPSSAIPRPVASWPTARAPTSARRDRASRWKNNTASSLPRLFFDATRSGDMKALGAMLAADVSAHADGGGKQPASPDPIFGFDEVMKLHAYLAKQFQAHQLKLVCKGFINGLPGLVVIEAVCVYKSEKL